MRERPNVKTLVGHRIREARRALEWSQEELAKRSGTAREVISRIEAGRENVTIKVLDEIAQALNLSFTDLFTDKNDKYEKRKRTIILRMANAVGYWRVSPAVLRTIAEIVSLAVRVHAQAQGN